MKTIFKLTKIPYGQATVSKYLDGTIVLTSYTTQVAIIDNEGWLEIYGLYSMTTRKHIGAFVKEYCSIDYNTAKMLYCDRYKYNIYTGEILPL